jgi:hypothetical protein
MERNETERNFRILGQQPKFRFAPFWHSFCNFFNLLDVFKMLLKNMGEQMTGGEWCEIQHDPVIRQFYNHLTKLDNIELVAVAA